ncbi:MAG: hypothetical protein V3T17_16415 [Pseudomonadales bacterium]
MNIKYGLFFSLLTVASTFAVADSDDDAIEKDQATTRTRVAEIDTISHAEEMMKKQAAISASVKKMIENGYIIRVDGTVADKDSIGELATQYRSKAFESDSLFSNSEAPAPAIYSPESEYAKSLQRDNNYNEEDEKNSDPEYLHFQNGVGVFEFGARTVELAVGAEYGGLKLVQLGVFRATFEENGVKVIIPMFARND